MPKIKFTLNSVFNNKEKVIKALEAGQNAKDVSVYYDVGISWVYKRYRRYRNTGNHSYKALPRPGLPCKIQNDDRTKLKQLVDNNPSATLEELKQMSSLTVRRTTIYKILQEELKITYKKLFLRRNKTLKKLNKFV